LLLQSLLEPHKLARHSMLQMIRRSSAISTMALGPFVAPPGEIPFELAAPPWRYANSCRRPCPQRWASQDVSACAGRARSTATTIPGAALHPANPEMTRLFPRDRSWPCTRAVAGTVKSARSRLRRSFVRGDRSGIPKTSGDGPYIRKRS
jgi:hypothetical protein